MMQWLKWTTLIHILFISISSAQLWWTEAPLGCSCEDRAFFVEYTSSYTRHDVTYGYDVHCYTYTITRSEDYNQHDLCTEQIDFVELGVSTSECDHTVADLEHIIIDYGASTVFNCTTTLLRDEEYGILGMRYNCDFAPQNDVNIYFCTTVPDTVEDGHIAYVSNSNYGYACTDAEVPNFCGDAPDHHEAPVIQPTPKPTWPTLYPTLIPTLDPTAFPTEFPSQIPTREPTQIPTRHPTRDPTVEPTPNPTESPTQSPTNVPSSTPTRDPTSDPTTFPSPQPTRRPTESPNMAACPNHFDVATDIVFLVDTSCYNGLNQCNEDQQEFIAELFTSVVGPQNENRASYIRFDSGAQYIDIALDNHYYDTIPITQTNVNAAYQQIRTLPFTNTGSYPDLAAALQEAYKQFDIVGHSDDVNRDKKVVIISNTYTPDVASICTQHQTKIHKSHINVYMINMGATPQPVDDYILCLVNYDPNSIFTAPVVNLHQLIELLPSIQTEICSNPTPSPTSDPTHDPTGYPTQFPTENPSSDPTREPTAFPTDYPTELPSRDPTMEPTPLPTPQPTGPPTPAPTANPTRTPTADPTAFPTDYPTDNPSRDPTADPTDHPSQEPTGTPTTAPTSAPSETPTPSPTTYPTPAPTELPTPSPNMFACENGGRLDVVFLMDTSGFLSDAQCADRNEFVGEVFTSVKGANNIVRAGMVRFGATDISVDIALDAAPFNTILPPTQSDMNALYNYIRTLPCSTTTGGGVNLNAALLEAYNQFTNIVNSDDFNRDKKIVIISNNFITAPQRVTLCANHADKIRKSHIDLVMVNLGHDVYNNEGYIMCLVEYDETRIFEENSITFNPDLELFIPEIRNEICSDPTPAPTSDPTRDPTTIPTDYPTDFPSEIPTADPTQQPTDAPTNAPTAIPSVSPTSDPTLEPTPWPTVFPTSSPTVNPTREPTAFPTDYPSNDPTTDPTPQPTESPTTSPTQEPTRDPTRDPTDFPTDYPTEYPTRDPTKDPTIVPTQSPTSPACPLYDSYEFAIVVDNSCGLNYAECLIQRDQVAELLSMLKADNEVDNPKVAYIEYNAEGANVRVSLDDPLQAHTRQFYDYIRNHGVCGDGGDGQTDLLSGLLLALNEFNVHGNPNAVQKIITINNCANQVMNDTYNPSAESFDSMTFATQDTAICTDIVAAMHAQGIDGYVVNVPAPVTRAVNTITHAGGYLACFADGDTNRVYSGGHHQQAITMHEYHNALEKAIDALCSAPTSAPTADPTRDPTEFPTDYPTENPSRDPTLSPTPDPTTDPTRDPTDFPTDYPTENPSRDPTNEPTTQPTAQPTRDPTDMPSPFPTERPTPQPTRLPTPSPNMAACENGGRLDIVFLIDTSLNMTDDECTAQNEFVAELYTAVKGAQNIVRAAYIRFDAGTQHIDVALDAAPYNIRDAFPAQSDINILYNYIRDQACTTTPTGADSAEYEDNNLNGALQAAYAQFDDVGSSDGGEYGGHTYSRRDKKIIIVSNNYLSLPQQDEICALNEDKIRTGSDNPNGKSRYYNGINVVMINLRRNIIAGDDDDYISCVVGHDNTRIYTAPIVNYYPELEDLVPTIRDEVCSAPTSTPTADPTRDPTTDPSPFPTPQPTESPTNAPTNEPTVNPTPDPTNFPTDYPTDNPSRDPTYNPTPDPTVQPTRDPTEIPTEDPTPFPTNAPTAAPTPKPTRWPSQAPTLKPTDWPSPAPTPGPTDDPTLSPTPSPTNEACVLQDFYEFAIVVDNSCGLTDDECDLQRDEIAELYSLLKEDNIQDNPKVTYIEYGADGAEVRISLDNPLQARTRAFYDFIRNHGHCGSGGDGESDLLAGLEAALSEFNTHGNPGAIQKIITINNCVNTHNDSAICDRIKPIMDADGIGGVVINVPAPNGRASNVIVSDEKEEYLSCFSNTICVADAAVYDSGEMNEDEYNNAYSKCLAQICEVPATLAPTMTRPPTVYVPPTYEPTHHPTVPPTLSPSDAPTRTWWTHTTTKAAVKTDAPSRAPSKWPTAVPSTRPTTAVPTPQPTPGPSKWPTGEPSGEPTPFPSPQPTPRPTADPTAGDLDDGASTTVGGGMVTVANSTDVMSTMTSVLLSCPVCLADDGGDDDGDDDGNYYLAVPRAPKDVQFSARSAGININNDDVSTLSNDGEGEGKGVRNYYSSWTYFAVLCVVLFNVIFCLWYILKTNKKEVLLGYIGGHRSERKALTEADVSDYEDEDEDEDIDDDEYRTSGDEEEEFSD